MDIITVTKKDLIDRIAEESGLKRTLVKRIVQRFLDEIISELVKGNRLEFRDFGIFECRVRQARMAQNPKTLEPVPVPEKRNVKFKVGRHMREKLDMATEAQPTVSPRAAPAAIPASAAAALHRASNPANTRR